MPYLAIGALWDSIPTSYRFILTRIFGPPSVFLLLNLFLLIVEVLIGDDMGNLGLCPRPFLACCSWVEVLGRDGFASSAGFLTSNILRRLSTEYMD